MHILCPHCHNPIELVRITPREEIACPACGSTLRLETGGTTGSETSAGQRLGRFQLIETLGQGAFGTVYKAHDPELDRTVAVKVPRAGNLAGADDLDRFLREARSAAQLQHPSIVTVHDVGKAGGVKSGRFEPPPPGFGSGSRPDITITPRPKFLNEKGIPRSKAPRRKEKGNRVPQLEAGRRERRDEWPAVSYAAPDSRASGVASHRRTCIDEPTLRPGPRNLVDISAPNRHQERKIV